MSDDAAVKQRVCDRVTHIVVSIDHERCDRLSDDAFFAAKILKKLLLVERTVAIITGCAAINSAACWVLELDNHSFSILLLKRVELVANCVAHVAQAAPGVESEFKSHNLANSWNNVSLCVHHINGFGGQHVEDALSLHGVFWELTEVDLAQTFQLADSEGWLVELCGNVGDRGRLELHVDRVIAFGLNWLVWNDWIWSGHIIWSDHHIWINWLRCGDVMSIWVVRVHLLLGMWVRLLLV